MLCKLLTRIKKNQLVKMSKCLEKTHQDFVVRSSDFRVEKTGWERPLRIFVLHLRTQKRKNW